MQRKDFWEMFIHHNTTIALIALSWTAHFTRVIRLSAMKFSFWGVSTLNMANRWVPW